MIKRTMLPPSCRLVCLPGERPTTLPQVVPMSLTHFDAQGQAHMVDVGPKTTTHRVAVASGQIHMHAATLALIESGTEIGRAHV